MNSSLFGSREYYSHNASPYRYLGPPSPIYRQPKYQQHAYQYPRYQPTYQHTYQPAYQHTYQPTYQQTYLQQPHLYGNSNLSYGLSQESPHPYQVVASPQHLQQYPYPSPYNYNWREPEIMIPAKGLETILIAILILVALDMLFVRSRH